MSRWHIGLRPETSPPLLIRNRLLEFSPWFPCCFHFGLNRRSQSFSFRDLETGLASFFHYPAFTSVQFMWRYPGPSWWRASAISTSTALLVWWWSSWLIFASVTCTCLWSSGASVFRIHRSFFGLRHEKWKPDSLWLSLWVNQASSFIHHTVAGTDLYLCFVWYVWEHNIKFDVFLFVLSLEVQNMAISIMTRQSHLFC